MSELSLDDDQRHALMRHLDRVRVTELMGREPAAHAGLGCGTRQLLAGRRRLSVATGGRATQHTKERADGQVATDRHPGF